MIPIFRLSSPEGAARWAALSAQRALADAAAADAAEKIVADVRDGGDAALFRYTAQFDCPLINAGNVKLTEAEIEAAYKAVDSNLLGVIRRCLARIRAFHEKQRQTGWIDTSADGEILGQLTIPIGRVGLYVPGGTAAYPSSVLMNAVPARVAGVSDVIVVSPPGKDGALNPSIVVAAREAGVSEIYKIGGAQAVAALAYGTGSVPRVDKIVGPGNAYVAAAKRAVFGQVGIDSVAGPSEILVVADDTANPAYVAADLLSQAEHDVMASAVLVTTSEPLAQQTAQEIERQTAYLSRKDIIDQSINEYGAIFVADTLNAAIDAANSFAPEHLELCVAEPFAILPNIKNAGAAFLGHYAPEPLGDYAAGPNHVLPTSGTARFFSALSVDDFTKKTSVVSFTKEAFDRLANDVAAFADAEGLTAHANAVRVRQNG